MYPPCSRLKLMRLSELQPKTLLHMRFNGTHQCPRTPGGYSYIFLYGDVPLNRVSFSGF